MEDLLASIRKAIHEDIGDVPVAGAKGPNPDVFKGSMRELRVKVGSEVSAAAAEIQELREKITRTRETAPPPRPPMFSDRPGADGERWRLRRPPESPPQALRPSFAESEMKSFETPQADRLRRLSREAETLVPAASWRDEVPAIAPPVEARGAATAPNILSAEASAAASSAFNRLADTILSRAVGDRSVEDMTRELLRNMLKQWLDENLPALVERLVREEIERVARRGR